MTRRTCNIKFKGFFGRWSSKSFFMDIYSDIGGVSSLKTQAKALQYYFYMKRVSGKYLCNIYVLSAKIRARPDNCQRPFRGTRRRQRGKHAVGCIRTLVHPNCHVFSMHTGTLSPSARSDCALTLLLLFRRMTGSRMFSQGVSFSGSVFPMPLRCVLLSLSYFFEKLMFRS